MERHARQAKLREVGAAGQARLARAVVRVGLEGFAADVAARYLAGAGVARVTARDPQVVVGVRSIDAVVQVDIDPSLPVEDLDGFDLAEPAAREFAGGARAALRALREALGGPSAVAGGSS